MKTVTGLFAAFIVLSTGLSLGIISADRSHPEFDPSPSFGSLQGSWSPPLKDYVVEKHFLAPVNFVDNKHRGVDLVSTTATIRAPAAGVVSYRGFIVNRPVLTIDHLNGLKSSFEPLDSDLIVGDFVQSGSPIGTIASPQGYEHCATSCLHFGVRLNGRYLNPLLLLGDLKRSVLLPEPSPIRL